jgi:hypothetical protein
VSSKGTINRSEWESRCLWLSVLPFRSANYIDGVGGHGEEFTNRMFDNMEPEKVVSLSRSELVSVLDSSGLMYVLVDPTPGDQPQPEHLPIRLAWEFAEGLRDG